jgi:predicted dienelactone hydrolase
MRFSVTTALASALFASACAMHAAADNSLPGPFVVSQRTVTVTRPNSTTFSAQIRYPATATTASAPFNPTAGPAPAITFGHGFLSAVDLYDSTMDHLASHGYIVIATTSGGELFPNHANYALDMRYCLTWLEQQDALKSSWLFGAVDQSAFGVSGHSMGGGASALAAAADARIKALCTLAAAETNPSSSSAMTSVQRPSRFIVGSQDTIVPPSTTAAQYNACDAPRQTVNIAGGSHCGFIDSPIIACDSGSISRAEQLAKTRALMLEFFDAHLRARAPHGCQREPVGSRGHAAVDHAHHREQRPRCHGLRAARRGARTRGIHARGQCRDRRRPVGRVHRHAVVRVARLRVDGDRLHAHP